MTAREGRLVITRVLLHGDDEAEVASLRRESDGRPYVYCPFCGAHGLYRLPQSEPASIIPHFAHAHDDECAPGLLEGIRHRRAKRALLDGLQSLREQGRPLLGKVDCHRCKQPYARELLPARGWVEEREEVEDSATGRKPDVVAFEAGGGLAFLFEVHATHAVDWEKARAYEEGPTAGVELDVDVLVDGHGAVVWTGSGPLEKLRSAWHLERAPRDYSVCATCRALPQGLAEFVDLALLLQRVKPSTGLDVLHTAAETVGFRGHVVVAAGAQSLRQAVERPEALREPWGEAAAGLAARQAEWPPSTSLLTRGFKLKETPWDALPLPSVLDNPYTALCVAVSQKRPVAEEILEVADLLAEVRGLRLPVERCVAYAGLELVRALRDGHAACLVDTLAKSVAKALPGSAEAQVSQWLRAAAQAGDFLVGGNWEQQQAIALKAVADVEASVSRGVWQRRKWRPSPPSQHRLRGLTEEQHQAVEMALRFQLSVITGGPGTGKTHVVSGIVRESWRRDRDATWYLAAPTNKAVQRLRLKTDTHAWKVRTVHAWLNKKKDLEEKPPYGLIVDEASFLDLELMAELLELARGIKRLVLVGDPHQLPSVGYGAVLKDLLGSGKVQTVKLTQVHRVDKGRNALITAAEALLRGELPPDGEGVRLVTPREDVVDVAFREFERLVEEAKGNLSEVQVLAPNRDIVKTINERIQARFNRDGQPVPCAPRLRVKDRVVCTETVYGTGLFNGLQGEVVGGSAEGLSIKLEGEVAAVTVSPQDARVLSPAYAMTVHKAQGSEWAHVLIVAERYSRIFDRNLLYTAATRAQRSLTLVGPREEFASAARKVRPRVTLLEGLLQSPPEAPVTPVGAALPAPRGTPREA
ncbi:AAA family ATPase [Pyxidicoccus sp. 3LFB2]